MFGLWRARGARRAATAALAPFMQGTRQRYGGIPNTAWSDPYMIGFLGMLITLLAKRAVGPLGPDALASVQAGTWSDLTGSRGDLVGDEICFLSTSQETNFVLGCSNAEAFVQGMEAIVRRANGVEAGLSNAAVASMPGNTMFSLWAQYFDAYLVDLRPGDLSE